MVTAQQQQGDDPSRLKAAQDLEWPRLLRALADLCVSEQGVVRMQGLAPVDTLAEAQELMGRSAEALAALALGEPVPARAVPAIDGVLSRLARGGLATGEELRDSATVLTVARSLRAYGQAHRELLPRLAEILHSDPALDDLLAELQRTIDSRGRVTDGASAALGDARRRAQGVRRLLLEKLSLLGARYADVLRDRGYEERDGRYGLPVRADAHRRVEGIVLGTSASGATLYIEPPQITELGNRLKLAEADIEREEARVLAELSTLVSGRVAAVAVAYEACIAADVLAALSRWAEQSRAVAVMPDEGIRIELLGMRHPLLVLQDGGGVVENDLRLRAGSALVISGPNAGGKTVVLKCLGLAVWMARSGIPLPVKEGSRIGWFREVLTDIGDAQSIERSLSTFSAHIANVSAIIARADERALVLLDEIAGGTDPEQGAALATAVLGELLDRGSAIALTTHYERLKDLATTDERFENASVGFDFDELRPTFVLREGIPGASSALAVAAHFGLPAPVVELAQTLLPEASVRREQLLAQIERQQQQLAQALAAATEQAEQAAELKAALEAERQVARSQERRKLARESAELIAAIQQARRRLREVSATKGGSGSPSAQDRSQAERIIDEAARLISVGGPLHEALASDPVAAAEQRPATAAELVPGTRVFIPRLGTTAEVLEPPERGQLRVSAGAFVLRVGVDELRCTEPKPRRPRQAPRGKRSSGGAGSRRRPPVGSAEPAAEPAVRVESNTCDLRGLRVEEALERLEQFIDRQRLSGDSLGFALHGHGTGALKQAVREHLATSASIACARPAEQQEGGDAFTVYWISH